MHNFEIKKPMFELANSVRFIQYSGTCLLGTPVGPSKSVRTSQVSSHRRDMNYRQFF